MANKERIISFPHIGNYYVAIEFLIKNTLNMKILIPPPITKKTIELGSKYSPDFVCVPFKYNLGNYIEALEAGANFLVQAGGGCRFGYYGETQEQILKDIGYDFEFLSILNTDDLSPFSTYGIFKNLNPKLSLRKFTYYFSLTFKMVEVIDSIEEYIRENIGFEVKKGSFEKLQKNFLNEIKTINNFKEIKSLYKKYDTLFKNVSINKPQNPIRVGIVGELYTVMEPYGSYFIEKELAKKGIEITRFITVTYLFKKHPKAKDLIKNSGKYLKYTIGADGTDSVSKAKQLAEAGYDGIIHFKPFGCTPEVNAMPMLQNISNDYNMPILYFSFDSQSSETGIKTRLEAFYDMISMKREKEKCKNVI
ncbi:Predicted nucleotide-binding protein, sugar kinase/HSP70/actin superfamily [Clostridium cavendishii DSM 21758]|uniref:Predicted nucleotide-binding protein, sugar kinase/HSP70/actin superfamily n=1 Tax=Clostridium cavendishii DSM 21758 TaxID=1121302 RepID=A0A1M6FFN0_9CLOT|nr:2-hydroxyacyl-CoA dehydratase [Clostridium cavendishii]SHI96469.1 Predicted nucleotide-binding protein, sugar kinase/HSP70/actin superfamily [Clostridium cavendishii DSM 21758]